MYKNKMKCRKCGSDLPEGSKYCNLCGVKQAQAKTQRKRGNRQGNAVKRGKTWTAIWFAGFEIEGRDVRQQCSWKGGFPTKTSALAYVSAHP